MAKLIRYIKAKDKKTLNSRNDIKRTLGQKTNIQRVFTSRRSVKR